ncbi:MAG: hypothetical protein KF784_05940 [Fimbriimonadaceae bacterium]|nr:hypothetical protein [Fimbriimonadaceae bacterium]
MSRRLEIDRFRLTSRGPTLSVTLLSGQSLGVFGPAASGKSWALRVFAGIDKSPEGTATQRGTVATMGLSAKDRRSSPQVVAKRISGREGALRAGEAIDALRLWDHRQLTISELSPTQQAGCDLLPVLASHANLLVVDSTIEMLDPWVRERVWKLLELRLTEGAALVHASNDPALIPKMNSLLVLRDKEIVFAGRYQDLLRNGVETELLVETQDQPGVRALVAPFEVSISETPKGLLVRGREGQAIAAKLLVEGYGDVKSVLVKSPSPEDLLKGLLG